MLRVSHRAIFAIVAAVGCLLARPATAQTTGAAEPAPPPPTSPSPITPSSPAYPSTMEPITGPIRAGDTLFVTVVGETPLTGPITVDKDGSIVMPMAGAIAVQGDSPSVAAEKIRTTLQQKKLLKSPVVTVIIASRPARTVSISGAVTNQGQMRVKDGTRLNEVVEPAGLLPSSDAGRIVITRGDQRIPVDYLPYRTGSSDAPANNPVLEDGDRIFVYSKTIVEGSAKVVGEVKNPQLLVPITAGITASQLIAQAGGTTPTADPDGIYVQRGQERVPVPLKEIQENKTPDVPLQDGDQVVIPKAEKPKVYAVTGGVYKPETYPLESRTTLLEAVNKAGGQVSGAKTKEIQIRRVASEGTVASKKYDLDKPEDAATVIEPGDSVFVPYPDPPKQRFGFMEILSAASTIFFLLGR